MKLHHISLGNLRRRKSKAFLLFTALSIGVALVIAMKGITAKMQEEVQTKMDEYGANIIITPKSEGIALSYGGVSLGDASFEMERLEAKDVPLIREIHSARNISAVAPKVIGVLDVNKSPYLVVGVDFLEEFRIKKWWHVQGGRPKGRGEVLLGNGVAQKLFLKPGQALSLKGKPYKVAGILQENASQDDSAIFMELGEAQRLLGKKGEISMIEVSALCSECPIEDIVRQISHKLPHAKVSPVRQAMALRMQTVGQLVSFSLAVSAVVSVIGSLVVFISMLGSVNERTKEIGVLRALGFRRKHIVKIIMLEAFIVSAASGAAGWILGSLSISALAPYFLEKPVLFAGDYVFPLLALGMSVSIGLLSSIYPALKAAKLEPIEALRYI